jgi:DNA repair protein RadA/Sms
VPGTCVTVSMEGRRALASELQALVGSSQAGNPRRATSGLDGARVAMLLAVLDRRAGLKLFEREVYAATVGGVRLTDPAADLALALAVAGAWANKPMPAGVAAIGEVGLAGEIRPVTAVRARATEAARLGFTHILVPREFGTPIDGVRVVEVATLSVALSMTGVAAG